MFGVWGAGHVGQSEIWGRVVSEGARDLVSHGEAKSLSSDLQNFTAAQEPVVQSRKELEEPGKSERSRKVEKLERLEKLGR